MQINYLSFDLIFPAAGATLPLMGDLLLALFLVGLLAASGSFLGMARIASRTGSHHPATALGVPDDDLLEDYRRACAEDSRPPLLWYAYLASLWVGVGALLLAFL